MENIPLPDVGSTLTHIAGLSPTAQLAAIAALTVVFGLLVWTRRPIPGPDAGTVVKALELTAQSQAETAASMATIARTVEGVAEDVRAVAEDLRSLTHAVLTERKEVA
ncbi:hypothetical protein [Azospirillum sp. B510]|uniref:hypothetical protein n=1 Tax=Azospirillum sp. (strain B510) TaxID=137722 RepID=UPI0002E23390|nr:hypothetical protein [Azospirillum sp. B510]